MLAIGELAKRINRKPNTILKWERAGKLPPDLMPYKDERGHRYYTHSQADLYEQWMEENVMRPGNGLPNYNPTPEDVERHIDRLRRPRDLTKKEMREIEGMIDREEREHREELEAPYVLDGLTSNNVRRRLGKITKEILSE